MSSTALLVVTSIIILLVLFLVLYLFRERVEVQLDGNSVLLKYPFKTKRINLEQDLQSWKVQEAHYLRWGNIYSINLLLKNGQRLGVNSRFNQENFDLLLKYLSTHFKSRRELE